MIMKYHQKNKLEQSVNYQLIGWILFILCSFFFLASAIKNHDTLTIIGSVIFFIACIIFLIPLIFSSEKAVNDYEGEDL